MRRAVITLAVLSTLCLGYQIFTQNFDSTWSTNVPPTGWRIYHSDTTEQGAHDWHRNAAGSVPWPGHGSPYAALYWSVLQDSSPDSLISPIINCTGYENVALRCSTHYFRKYPTGFQATLAYSTDGGATFPPSMHLRDYALVDSFEGEETFSLTYARNQDSIVLAWIFDDSLYNINWWCIDHVVVEGDSLLDWDVACDSINIPSTHVQPGTLSPEARFFNYGISPQYGVPVLCSLYDNVMAPLAAWQDSIDTLPVGTARNVTFSPAYSIGIGDSYYIKFWCAADSDYDRSNDTLDRYFRVDVMHQLSYCSNTASSYESWPIGHHGWGVKFGLPAGVNTAYVESLQVRIQTGTGPTGNLYQLALVHPDTLTGRPLDMFYKTPVLTGANGWNSVFMADTGEHVPVTDSFFVFYLQVGEPPESPALGIDDAATTGAQYWRYREGAFQQDTPPGDYLVRAWVQDDTVPRQDTDARCLYVEEPWYEFVQRPFDRPLEVKARVQNHGYNPLPNVAVLCSVMVGNVPLFLDSMSLTSLLPGQDTLVTFSPWVDTLPGSKRCSVIVRTGGSPDMVTQNDDKRFGFDLWKGAFTGLSPLGYAWIDSDTTDGPTYSWVDTSGADVVMATADDQRIFVDFGFGFPYYDSVYDYAHISSNGWLLFGEDQQTHAPNPLILPDPSLPNAALYPYWADLRFGTGFGGGKLYRKIEGISPNRRCTFIWQDVLRVGTSDTTNRISFQLVLHENGSIEYQYQDVDAGDLNFDNAKNAGIGLEDEYGADGLTYLYAGPPMSGAVNDLMNRVSDGQAVRLYKVYRDVAALEITSPLGYQFPGEVTPMAKIQNYGTVDDTIRVSMTILPGAPPYHDSVIVPGLNPGDSAIVSFAPLNLGVGNFRAICSTKMAGDVDLSNNNVSKVFIVSPWIQRADIPEGWRRRKVKGAATAYAPTTNKLYALKGSNDNTMWVFDIATGTWDTVAPMPNLPSGRRAKYGCDLTFDPDHGANGYLWAIKGGRRTDFYAYDIAADTWLVKPPVFFPHLINYRPPSKGAALHYSPNRGAEGRVYCIPGNNTNFLWAYDIADTTWDTLRPVPLDYDGRFRRCKHGSDLTGGYGNDTIYVAKGSNTYEVYGYMQSRDTWAHRLDRVSLVGPRRKKVKSGASMTYHDGALYLLKGGNTQEFWRYHFADTLEWQRMTDIPISVRGRRKKCKRGSALESIDSTLLCLKGSYTYEFWEYSPGGDTAIGGLFGLGQRPRRSGVAAEAQDLRGSRLKVWPNPTVGSMTISYSVPAAAQVRLRIYDASGQLVRGLVDTPALPGRHTVRWDGRNNRQERVAAGVYFLKLTGGQAAITRKLVIQR
ncbi:MAG: T9SS type A sorting domain-containing protein [candidate division WOR-3 bacterium]|nr:MAG: T9SS type A sorting domain-containing protein [candidate division WOR-3 bacterium]